MRSPAFTCISWWDREIPRLQGWSSTRPTPRGSRGSRRARSRSSLADPAANAETVLAQVRECHAEGVAVAVFPELCLSGYSIDDLLLQDTLLTAVQDAIATLVAARPACCR